MINFELFEEAINTLKSDSEYMDELYKVGLNVFERINSDSIVTKLLFNAFNLPKDDFYNDIISWWCFEQNFGETAQMWEKDGTPIDVSTPEKFYEFLISASQEE